MHEVAVVLGVHHRPVVQHGGPPEGELDGRLRRGRRRQRRGRAGLGHGERGEPRLAVAGDVEGHITAGG